MEALWCSQRRSRGRFCARAVSRDPESRFGWQGYLTTEVIRHAGPWRGLDVVEFATLEWVSWFNTSRLLEPLGYLPSAEYETQFQKFQTASDPAGVLE